MNLSSHLSEALFSFENAYLEISQRSTSIFLKELIHLHLKENETIYSPNHIVYADDVLLFRIFGAADDRSASLNPRVSAIFVHQSIVVSQNLTFVDH